VTDRGLRVVKAVPSDAAAKREGNVVRVLGLILVALSVIGFSASGLWLAALRDDAVGTAGIAFQPALAVTILAAVAFFLPWLAAGIGLITNRVWGRPVATIVCMMLLFVVPVGTLIGIFGFYALRNVRRPVLSRPSETAWTPAEYADYAADPRKTRTCVHLAPVEAAMRAAGIAVRPHWANNVEAKCRVDLAALRRRFGAMPTVVEGDVPEDTRSADAPRWAHLHCVACGSLIHLARVDAGPETPVFPPPNA
jgi:hypothetical protein